MLWEVWTHQEPTLLEADLQPLPRKNQKGGDISACLKAEKEFPKPGCVAERKVHSRESVTFVQEA